MGAPFETYMWVTEALNRTQKSQNIMVNAKFSYSLLGSFLIKTNDFFTILKMLWKHLLNPIWVTEALNRHQKGPHMVLNVKFSEPYSQYPVRAQAYMHSHLALVTKQSVKPC